jgi:hypothetical protein
MLKINNPAQIMYALSTAFCIITIKDTFKMVLPHDGMDIHMFNKVKKRVNNKEMLLKINV